MCKIHPYRGEFYNTLKTNLLHGLLVVTCPEKQKQKPPPKEDGFLFFVPLVLGTGIEPVRAFLPTGF